MKKNKPTPTDDCRRSNMLIVEEPPTPSGCYEAEEVKDQLRQSQQKEGFLTADQHRRPRLDPLTPMTAQEEQVRRGSIDPDATQESTGFSLPYTWTDSYEAETPNETRQRWLEKKTFGPVVQSEGGTSIATPYVYRNAGDVWGQRPQQHQQPPPPQQQPQQQCDSITSSMVPSEVGGGGGGTACGKNLFDTQSDIVVKAAPKRTIAVPIHGSMEGKSQENRSGEEAASSAAGDSPNISPIKENKVMEAADGGGRKGKSGGHPVRGTSPVAGSSFATTATSASAGPRTKNANIKMTPFCNKENNYMSPYAKKLSPPPQQKKEKPSNSPPVRGKGRSLHVIMDDD